MPYVCNKCGREKAPDAFSLDRRRKSGRRSVCRSCQPEMTDGFRQRTREGILGGEPEPTPAGERDGVPF